MRCGSIAPLLIDMTDPTNLANPISLISLIDVASPTNVINQIELTELTELIELIEFVYLIERASVPQPVPGPMSGWRSPSTRSTGRWRSPGRCVRRWGGRCRGGRRWRCW